MIFLRRIFAIPLVLVVAFFVFIFGFHTAKAAVVFDNTAVPLPQNIDFNNRILSLPTNFRINLPDTKSHIGGVRLWVAHETAQYFANLYCNGILPGCDESQWDSGFGFGLTNLQIGWNGTFCFARPNNGNPGAIFFKDSPDHTWTEVTLILNDNYNSGSPEMTGCAIPADDSGNNFINTLSFGVGYGWTIATTPEGMPIMQIFDADEQKVPVLIVPGIMGTEVFKGEENIWPDINKMMLTNNDRFMDILAFNLDNTPMDSNLLIGSVLGKPSRFFDYSEQLNNDLISYGYESGKTLFTFPYDWRKDIGEIAKQNLKGQIDYILNQTEAGRITGKVDVIAHSQGGLVVKRLVYELPEYQDKINKLIFVGTPHLGSPKAAKALLYGDSMDVGFMWLGLDGGEVKRISQNMPSVYELLPSQKYFTYKNGYLGERTQTLESLLGMKVFNAFETQQKLKEKGLNLDLLNKSTTFHNTEYDDFDFSQTKIKTFNIMGCQEPTIEYLLDKGDDNFSLTYQAGDGTVPLFSAKNVRGVSEFYALNSSHGKMLTQDGIRNKIINILEDINSAVQNIETDISTCRFDGQQVSVHSPVNLHIFDEFGNHVGPMPDGNFEYGIEGVAYDIVGHEKFAFLPKQGIFTIKLTATDSGTFDFISQNIENGNISQTIYFNKIPVATTSQVTIKFDDGIKMIMDLDGDGVVEKSIDPSAVLNDLQSKDDDAPISNIVFTGDKGREENYKSDVVIELKSQDFTKEGEVSGVLKMLVKVDNGLFEDYQSPVLITTEGAHEIQFYSIDRAGNKEPIQIKKFVIDKHSPEFSVYFSTENKDLVFLGEDNLSQSEQVKITDNEDKLLLEDLAGNTTELKLKEKNRKKSLSAELVAIKYNNKEADISKNRFSFLWVYDKKGILKSLAQHIASKKDFALFSIYDGKNTKLMNWAKGALPDIKTYKGLKIIKINSNQGKLLWSID